MQLSDNQRTLLQLVRLGIGHQKVCSLLGTMDWPSIRTIANQQGLLAVLLDGIEQLPEQQRPPRTLMLEWIGNTLQSYDQRYFLYVKAIESLAGWYNRHGYRMMVLKGYACILDWPKPEHRPCGDIDIWLYGRQKEADKLLSQEKGVKIDISHHHHTVFEWEGFIVENHYDFVNVHADKSSRKIEKIFKELGEDTTYTIDIDKEKVYVPSPNLHSLFLVRHMVSHFASAEITMRQVLDWAFFVEKHTNEINWKWLDEMLNRYHMKEFLNCINAICVDNLGFSSTIFACGVQFNPDIKAKVLKDILEPAFTHHEPKGFIIRMVYKYRRWQGNAWKQKMCYSENRLELFLTGVWAKIIKHAGL